MKRSLFLLFALPMMLGAQSFHRGAIILDAGTGFEFLTTTKTYYNAVRLSDTTVSTKAASYNFNAGLEVGIKKRIGISARGRLNTFFTDLDDVLHDRTSMKSLDLMLSFAVHPIHRKKIDISLGTDLGASNLNVNFKTLSQLNSSGTGLYAALFLMPRFYWNRVGVHARITMPYMNYSKIKALGDQIPSQPTNVTSWKGNGYGLSVGVQLRIL